MCRFLVSLTFLTIVVCGLPQHHHIHRRGVQIRGSFGEGLKENTFLSNRFGETSNADQLKINNANRRIQIRGSFGGIPSGNQSQANTGNVLLENRLGEDLKDDTSGLSGGQAQINVANGSFVISSGSQSESGSGIKSLGGGLYGGLVKEEDEIQINVGNGSVVISSGGQSKPGSGIETGSVGDGLNSTLGNLVVKVKSPPKELLVVVVDVEV